MAVEKERKLINYSIYTSLSKESMSMWEKNAIKLLIRENYNFNEASYRRLNIVINTHLKWHLYMNFQV
ncbi:unnamed protein product [Blepharisma stoltei]|uniref:Ribosomal protein L20 n=1 Tax=Blepharisma stoltei TaxID=1481888 RepID=A0AAU9IZ19_9CILI|nr:unnamed protein product [Blepharisma stoltei]